ncbi:hypothetical protein AAFC00_002764 [Neodothiora populina]|uniref:U1-type domain-containing protein n=1 Tax=Neodothiora populina TaxID=2781224 RepID=A0ABR3P8G7_9PEZI
MSHQHHSSWRAPLIAVVGSTGTGKSELAVNIAKRYNGEIINGDAMQLYKGLPIITNKIPLDEQEGIPHHLLGEIGLDEQTWTVGDFVTHALQKIQEIRSRGRLPVLVGGTHYYTQSLLFHDTLAGKNREDDGAVSTTVAGVESGEASDRETQGQQDSNAKWPILGASTPEILAELRKVDPVMADRWHPKDHRKIRRSLEMYLQTGRPASETYAEQRARRGAAATPSEDLEPNDAPAVASPLRTRTLVLWVNAKSPALAARLDARVDKMLSQGLLDEVATLSRFADEQARAGKPVDMTRGIWVSIGYKEFLEYYCARHPSSDQPLDPVDAKPDLDRLFSEATERTKAATRQYSKRQTRWIRIKLATAIASASKKSPSLVESSNASVTDAMSTSTAQQHKQRIFYLLDSSNTASWTGQVSDPALDLVGKFLQEKDDEMPNPRSLSSLAAEMLPDLDEDGAETSSPNSSIQDSSKPRRREDLSTRVDLWVRKYCEVCDMTAVTESDWLQHTSSKKHRIKTKKAKLEAEGLGGSKREQYLRSLGKQTQVAAKPSSDNQDGSTI